MTIDGSDFQSGPGTGTDSMTVDASTLSREIGLIGGDGNDVLIGGAGDDTIEGDGDPGNTALAAMTRWSATAATTPSCSAITRSGRTIRSRGGTGDDTAIVGERGWQRVDTQQQRHRS